ncbi:MAG: proton-conducting transporter membrane subunit [Candidatus Omnitrophica bacterium]|nr:proton-conducting transporter membrane subunit [Candidatus Omnitrophota bacterium]
MHQLLILLPFLSIIILNLPFKSILRKLAFLFGVSLCLFQIAFVFFPALRFSSAQFELLSSFLKFNLLVDNLTLVMLLCIGIVSFVSLLAAKRLIPEERALFNFTNVLIIALAGLNGIVMVKDIFSLYVFLEITAVASFILIVLHKDIFAFEGAFKYLILSTIATTLLLSSIALFLLVSGSTEYSAISAGLKNSPNSHIMMLAIGLFLSGVFIKAGLMPFHGWVPDTYSSAPAPVSIFLAGIVTKTVGVYTLIRIVTTVTGFTAPIRNVLLFVGAFTIVIGAFAALGQNDFKRMLSYSSISQVGYIVLGLGSGTMLGVAGAAFHLFNHAIFKSLLFVNAASVESATGLRDMNKMSGLSARMPLTGVSSCLASLSTAGVPPLSGFWSKLVIIVALWMSGRRVYALIAVLASVVTLAYFLSMQRRVFFGKLGVEFANIKEQGFALGFAAVLLSLIVIGVGLFFPFVLNSFILPVGNIFGG